MESRENEALKLYEPLPFQDAYHACTTKECLLMKANRAGGSLAGFVEDARAATNQDPYDKYPKEGTLACLGYGEKHIGRVIHAFLFEPGAFRIVKDQVTGKWRTFRPWPATTEYKGKCGDDGREKESQPAPPLIPPRFIEGKVAWVKASDKIFSSVRLTTGWKIWAFNSAGSPDQAQGFNVDLYHIDEDTATGGWYREAIGRTGITKGKLRWTALPHAKNDDIMNLMHRAEDNEADTTTLIRASMFDNPYYPEESKQANIVLWKSEGEDVYRNRALGQMVLDSILMYPTFSKDIHGAASLGSNSTAAQKIFTDNNGIPPEDWCRYMVVDPGHSTLAVLFFAVPPPRLGSQVFCYDELYLKQATAEIFGIKVAEKVRNYQFQDFIIDAHGGRLREIGSGLLPRTQYERQMEKQGIACVERGAAFRNGSDDIAGREMKMRSWLSIREDGHPTFLINVLACPHTCREFERFKKLQVLSGGVMVPTDKGNRRGAVHGVECAEYAAAHGLEYIKPSSKRIISSPMKRILNGRKRRKEVRAARSGGKPNNGISLGPKGVG